MTWRTFALAGAFRRPLPQQFLLMKSATNHRKAWLIKAPIGLVILSFGLCLVVEAGQYKSNGAATVQWIAYGTAALVVFNAGLCIFADAVRHRVMMER
ncbi:MAG: hypothetical protein ACI81P_000428 [Neolewinella sp.]